MSRRSALALFLEQLYDKTENVSVPLVIVKALGGWPAAIVFSEIAFWVGVMGRPVYKSAVDLAEKLHMSESTVKRAVAELRRLEVIDTELKKANGAPVNHFTVNYERLAELLSDQGDPGTNPSGQNDPNDRVKMTQSLTEPTSRAHQHSNPSSAFADGMKVEVVISEDESWPDNLPGYEHLGPPLSSPSTRPSPTERARAKKENDASRILELRDAWNANCGKLPKITAVNPRRERYFRRLIKEAEAAGIDPVNAMSVVAATVAQNDYYQQRRYNVEHALSDGKWLKHYETGVARGLGPQEAIDHGFVKGQLVRWLIDPRFPKQGHNMGIFRGVNERGLAQVECKAGDTTVIRTPRLELLEAADEPA